MQYKNRLTETYRQFKKGESHSLLAQSLQTPLWQAGGILDKALFIIGTVVEYVFVIHIGAIIGWLIGLWVGNVYFDNFPPEVWSKAFVLTKWGFMPCAFAKNSAIVGGFVSIIALAVINKRFFVKEVTDFYKKGVTSSDEVARQLSCSVWSVERTMRKIDNNIRRSKMRFAQIKNERGITTASKSNCGASGTTILESVSG